MVVAAAWVCGAGACSGPQKPAASRPNVLFIMADDMRPDCIGALGNPHIKTPNLDRLVERGTAFTRTYVLGANVGGVCLPSRTMLLSGRSVFHFNYGNGGFAEPDTREAFQKSGLPRLVANSVPWAKAMSAGGYETFHLGKPGNSYEAGMKAFDTCLYSTNGNGETESEKVADTAIAFLRNRKGARPFFMYVAPAVPHDPRVAAKQFRDMVDPSRIPLPARYRPIHPFDNGEMDVRDEKLEAWPRTEEAVRRHLADAYACITGFDHHLGRIFAALEEQGQLGNTIVIFASDNGLSLGDHGLMGKQNVYEFGGLHVALVMAGPGIPQGKCDAFAYLFDVYPTVCELTGTPVPAEVESKSLVPVMTGRASQVRDVAFTAYRDCQRAVRDDRWKMIRYPLIDRTQLFDLVKDPHELNDLSERPEHRGKVGEMLAVMERQQKLYGDRAPLKVANPKPAAWTPPR